MDTTTTVKVTGIDATYYLAQDLERATKFYTELLGTEPTMRYPGSISEWTFAGGESFGLYKPEEFHSSGGVMFGVPDLQAAVAACKARGVQMEDEITETPVCHMAFGEDTEGNGFILHQPK